MFAVIPAHFQTPHEVKPLTVSREMAYALAFEQIQQITSCSELKINIPYLEAGGYEVRVAMHSSAIRNQKHIPLLSQEAISSVSEPFSIHEYRGTVEIGDEFYILYIDGYWGNAMLFKPFRWSLPSKNVPPLSEDIAYDFKRLLAYTLIGPPSKVNQPIGDATTLVVGGRGQRGWIKDYLVTLERSGQYFTYRTAKRLVTRTPSNTIKPIGVHSESQTLQ